MKKITQNIGAGETITFPSCKTFVNLRSKFPVDFKFITMFNKIDRTITNFQDSFSVTANAYFLRVEITSVQAQELNVILIEDTGIEYTPITGNVFISNDDSNAVPVNAYITNSGLIKKDTLPVLQPVGSLLHVSQGSNFDKYPTAYTNYYIEHLFSSYISPAADAVNVHACGLSGQSKTGQPSKLNYLTEIKIISAIDCNFLIFLFGSSGGYMHGYSSAVYQNFYKNTVKYDNISTYCRCFTKTVPLADIESTDILYEKINVKSGEQKIIEFHTPILLDTRSSFSSQPRGFCTICSDVPTQYDIFFKSKYYTNEYFIPSTFS